MIDKQRVAQSFSRASRYYDDQAQFQRQVGEQLLSLLPSAHGGRVLDLGAGTGAFTLPVMEHTGASQMLAVDIAQGMNEYARQRLGVPAGVQWLTADAEQLPLADQSVAMIFSNLSLQWCFQLQQLTQSLSRVLCDGGELWFSSLDPGTLFELSESWKAVDDYQHVNRFLPSKQVLEAFSAAGLSLIKHQQEQRVLLFDQPMDVMRQLKGIGAHNVNADARHALTGAGRLRQMQKAYRQFRTEQGHYPASYQISYYGFRKEDGR